MKCFGIFFKSKNTCRNLSLDDGSCAPNFKKKEEPNNQKTNKKPVINSAFGEIKIVKFNDENKNNKKSVINSAFGEIKMEKPNEINEKMVDDIISTNIAISSNKINLQNNKNSNIVCNTISNNIAISGNQNNLPNNNIIYDSISTITIPYNQINDNIIDENIFLNKKNEYNIHFNQNKITYFYEENDVIPFLNLNVIYMGETGEHVIINGIEKMIFKFGKSYRSIDRDFREHKKTFANFKMIFIIHCENNDIVEDYLKIELKAKEMLYELPKKLKKNENEIDENKKQIYMISDVDYDPTLSCQKRNISSKQSIFSETFVLTDRFDLNYIINLMKRLVDEHPLKSIKERDEKIKELEINNKLREKDLELRIKQEETKQKQIELEKMKIELEMMKIKKY